MKTFFQEKQKKSLNRTKNWILIKQMNKQKQDKIYTGSTETW